MGLFDWLVTPGGQELSHALSVFLTAIAAYYAYRAHENTKPRNGH
jgi:hypothetical protein